ncbi:MAG: HpsJ family protein [Cyanobacterium sp.]
MKITTNFTSLGLKLVGVIIFVSALIDYLFLAIPLQLADRNWQINFANTIVDRGVVPLLAVVLLILGWWITDNTPNAAPPSKAVRLPVFIISSLLGLLFLLIVPIHLSNISNVSAQFIQEIDQRASAQEEEIQGFIEQLDAIARNPQQLQSEIEQRNQVINSGGNIQGQQLNPQELQAITSQRDQLQQLLELSQSPEELDNRLEETRTRLQTELREVQRQEKQNAQTQALRQTLRTGINSFMLSVGYIALGWLGIKGSMYGTPKPPSS